MNNQIYCTTRDDIINGKYPGGSFLVEGDLCEQFGVSRTPVREALIRLENDQFVQLIPGRGAYIPHVTINDIVDLYNLRKANDGLAAWLAVERRTPELVEQLARSAEREAALLERGDPDTKKISEEDFNFHNLLVSHCGNSRLINIINMVQNQMKRVTNLSADQYAKETLSTSLKYHQGIVEAFRTGDRLKARTDMETHWVEMIEGYITRDMQGRLSQLL